MPKFSRRDFLKLSAALPAAAAVYKLAPKLGFSGGSQGTSPPNVVILVLDAMSATNLSIYNYPRKTTPNFERLAERATVYHSHYSAGNFTVPGTASLLTGMYPWTHRAINQSGLIERSLTDRNIYQLFGEAYHRLGFSQNLWAVHLLNQFSSSIGSILSPGSFSVETQVLGNYFPNDPNAGYFAFDEFLFEDEKPPSSLVLGLPEKAIVSYKARESRVDRYSHDYPLGLPTTGLFPLFFRLDTVFNGLFSTLAQLTPPYLVYFHLWCVHEPYKPHEDFIDAFDDNWKPIEKPQHVLGGKTKYDQLLKRRRRYDQYIASVDAEFGRLLDSLEQSGILDNSYLVITSDHGESVERGTVGHTTPLLFDPLVHIPLIVSAPGQQDRQDVFSPTNSVDVLPTLLSLAGRSVPDWCEGIPLPGLGGSYDPQRSTFSIEAKSNPAFGPLKRASVAMRKGQYKFTYYTGYDYDFYELYDMKNDPEELDNLYEKLPTVAGPLQKELLDRFEVANRPYQK